MSHTTFKHSTEFVSEVRTAVDHLKRNLTQIERAFSEDRTVLKKETYHFVTRLLKPYNRVERTVYALIFKTAYQSEVMSAGSGYMSVVFSIAFLEALMKQSEVLSRGNNNILVEDYQGESRKILNSVQSLSVRPELSDISKVVSYICEDRLLSTAVTEAISLAGLEGSIKIENGQQASYIVELKHGYNFDLNPYKFFLPAEGALELNNVKVLLVDGMLEKVSEMEHLLLKSAATKTPMIIVAQGFEEEVVATLKANQDRGIFNVIPLRMQPDLDGLNVMNDLASVAGTDIVSSLKGEILTFKSYEDIPTVDNIRVTPSTLTIQNTATRGQVGAQVRLLFDKRSQSHVVEDISNLYDKRIQSLLAHSVTIRLPNMAKSANDSARVKIDIALRTNKSLMSYGTVDFEKVVEAYEGGGVIGVAIKEALQATIKQLNPNELVIPALTAYAGVHFAGVTMLSMITSSGLIEIVD